MKTAAGNAIGPSPSLGHRITMHTAFGLRPPARAGLSQISAGGLSRTLSIRGSVCSGVATITPYLGRR